MVVGGYQESQHLVVVVAGVEAKLQMVEMHLKMYMLVEEELVQQDNLLFQWILILLLLIFLHLQE